MIHSQFIILLPTQWPWLLGGVLSGLWLSPLARIIPRRVLQRAGAPLHEWMGPGGGLEQPASPARNVWVPVLNGCLWAWAAGISGDQASWTMPVWAVLASMLVLLALIDWDTTLLPDLLVVPLGVAGLICSYAGIVRHSLVSAMLAAAVVLGLLGGLDLLFRRIKGHRGIGGGDLKLLAALATWWGVGGVMYIVLLASLVTVPWYLAWRRFNGFSRQSEWPFGPAIAAAAMAWGLVVASVSGGSLRLSDMGGSSVFSTLP